jgi:hypothetical protein
MSIELLLLVNLNFAAFSIYLDDIVGKFCFICSNNCSNRVRNWAGDHNSFLQIKKLD